MSRSRSVLIWPLVLVLLAPFTGCSGGNGGGGGPLISITALGAAGQVFSGGAAATACPPGAFVNTRVIFRFGGAVDPATLPADGAATGGSITIFDNTAAEAATGTWSVDPADPTTVFFDADSPIGAAPCTAGLRSGGTYVVTIAGAGAAGGTITLGGVPVPDTIVACFTVAVCNPGNPSPALLDRVPGPPTVIASSPQADGTTPGTTVAAVADPMGPGSIITLDFDQQLDGGSVSSDTVLLANTTANPLLPVPVAVNVSFQQGAAGMPTRVTLTTSSPLNDADAFEISVDGIRDFEGLTLTTTPGQLAFAIMDENDDQPCTLFDDFTGTANLDTLAGSISWSGNGEVRGTSPEEIVGNGLDGIGDFNVPMTINTDTVITPGDPDARAGTFNFSVLDVTANLTASSTTDVAPGESNFPLRLLSQGSVTIGAPGVPVTIEGSGRRGADGIQLSAPLNSRPGGWGGPGGGRGGTASSTMNALSPKGDDGEGAHFDLTDPSRPGGQSNIDDMSPLFGGGGGGEAGLSPDFLNGPGGGGGGSASSFAGYGPGDPPLLSFVDATAGETHMGNDGMGAGAPLGGTPGPLPPAMLPPLLEAVGGSGGGAGGDRVITPQTPANSNPGAAGGGGGGGIGLGSGTGITINDGCVLDCSGGDGGIGIGFFIGGGAGGSGGSIVARSLGDISLGLGVALSTRGGTGNGGITAAGTLNGEGGNGGDGVVHLEDPSLNFVPDIQPNAVFVFGELFTQTLSAAGVTSGLATSITIDTGGSPDYTQAMATQLPATVTGTAAVRLVGIAESPTSPGTPAAMTMDGAGRTLRVGPVDLADIDMLDGFRYLVFMIETDYVLPMMLTGMETFPGIGSLTIDYVK